MTPVTRIVVFFQLVFIAYTFPDVEYIRSACNRRCESSLIYSGRSSGLFCDKDCSVLQCQDGCDVFPDVLNSTCSQACSEGIHQRVNLTGRTIAQDQITNCVQGCVFGLDEYFDRVTLKLAPLPQPTLVRQSKNYSSVFLVWPHKRVDNVTYIIHKKILETSSDWQRHKAFEFHQNDNIKIMQLHPYVTYKFKVLAIVTPQPRHVIESPDTVPITTLPHGVPTSAPKILRLSAPSPTVISLYWAAPLFPNGPVLGYRINLNPIGHTELQQTTFEVPPNVTSWTFSQCQSSQLYLFSLSAWNAVGEGPADVGNITTPNPGNLSVSETPYLVLGADNKVIKTNILDAARYPDTVTTESPDKLIKGVGVHVRRQLIIVSDSDGQVSVISLTGDHTMENHYPSILLPTAISVDWLADRVYIASRKRIYNCPLDRDTCFVAIDNLPSTPTDVKVDPVNGYLYFALHGKGRGLYRVDLTLIHRTAKPRPAHIVTSDDLHAFVIDFDNVQLYFPKFLTNTSLNTIMSSFLDGSNVKDFRPNVVSRAYAGITSFIYYDGAFFWTNRRTVWNEEYDPGFSAFHHNNMLIFGDNFNGLNLFHPKAQPTPVPLTAPTDVEVLFTPNRAQIQWQSPPRLQYQGRGAWSKWMYDIELQDVENNGDLGRHIQTAETSAMNHTVDGLTPDTVYHVRVRAKSEAGVGPWSTYFVGRTLQQEPIPVRVLLGVPGMIVEKDLSRLTQTTVVSFFSLPVDMTWHGDLLLWTTDKGSLYVYDRANSSKDVLNVGHAYSVAYDWLGGKIFWSEPKLGVIRRCDRRGIYPELIYQAEARDIAVDSIAGRLYWATANSIDTAYLNGDNHLEIFSVPFFSGHRVISLALNFDLGKLMWYVKSYDSQELYMADMIPVNGGSGLEVLRTVRPAGSFHSISQTSGLQYYSHRLFWVDGGDALVVGDMQCNYTSVVAPFNNVSAFAVAHPSMQDYPDGKSKESVFVIPEKLEPDSIRTVGDWSNFNLTWKVDTKVNHGTLFYKLYLKIGRQQIHKTTSDTWYNVRGLSAFTQMVVSLQPYTYWGYAEAVTLSIRSPMSIPNKPLTPRVYVTQHKNASTSQHSLAADFRWSTPGDTNGILSHHIITYWRSGHRDAKETVQVPGTSRHFILTPLSTSGTYFFQVVACTEAGCGGGSDIVSATTDSVNPVPMLMIATAAGVSVSEFDSDLNTTLILPRVSPSALAYLAQDNRTFWIEKRDSLFVSQNSQQRELVEMMGTGVDLTLDWISRTLYVVENDSTPHGGSSIMGYHMDQDVYRAIITTNKRIGSVISDPYTSMLLWTEIDSQGQGNLMSAPLGSNQSQIVLGSYDSSDSRRRKRSLFAICSCSDLINVSPTIAMDYTKQGSTEVIFVDVTSNAVLASDINGCNCSVVYRPPSGSSNGLPPSLLAVDHLRVYWYNRSEGRLYSINKDTGNSLRTQDLPGVQDIIAFGSHLQPLPDSDCLDPGAYSGTVSALTVTNTSVTLGLQPVKRPEQCGGISVPQDKFTVYYRKWSARSGFVDCSVPDDCMKKESYSTNVELLDLEPFTQYLVQVAVSNYYTEYLSEAMSDQMTFTTQRGMPYAARDVTVYPATPEEIMVEWMPPLELNGPAGDVSYVVHFSTVTSHGHVMRQTENLVLNKSEDGGIYTVLKGLETNHTYDIKVQACMKSVGLCNDSAVVQARTYILPNNITYLSATHDTLNLMWRSPSDDAIVRHNFEFAEVQDTEHQLRWQQRLIFPGITVTDTAYNETFRNLKPYTRYTFRLLATYTSPLYRVYIWPKDVTRFVFRTAAWVPEAPLAPMIRRLKTGANEVVWAEPEDNGDPNLTYTLQYSAVTGAAWKMAYNGSEQRWLVDESLTRPGLQYVFRVSASNSKGMGMHSENSTVFLAPQAAVDVGLQGAKIGVIVAVCFFVLVVVLAVCLVCHFKRKQREEIKKQQLLVVRGPDTELANLRQHPQSTFLQSNTLYGLPFVPTDADIAALPHVCRDQLDLTQFLGSGAFGEVYEGVARDILADGSGPVKCAIKTLRKSASDHEKEEFLKEAVLMRNFQYQHILGLLGVCLDNDPHFIIMELMEGGDLLTFLRSSRATLTTPAKLMLPDLVKVCVHVAKGCKYLEDKHFVHRDLAARNCLVSCSEPDSMVVKIGDFGLAREVYTQDYYRKVGEGLLPVRWMSPESLVDGVFTTQSDIWAFGVLMWEVLTLGQQPYPARTNIEVLHFVRAGGKLERPDKSTDEMFNLMQRCWSFIAEERPCFAYILQQLELYEEKCSQMSPGEIALHSPTGADAPATRHFPTNCSTTTSDGSTCSSSSSIASATQVQVYVAQSPSRRTRRRGGSERLTPASKKKRLVTLLGGADDKEKLVVDIPGRSRTSSLDSKRSSVSESSRTAYTQAHFPAVREYDAMGYLEPQPRRMPQYLQLLNQAPELLLPAFQDGRAEAAGITPQQQVPSASAFRPVGPYSRAALGAGGGGKNGGKFLRLGSNSSALQYQVPSPVPFSSNSSNGGRRSSSSSQTYGVVSVQDPTVERLIVDLTDVSRLKASQRKFSDQDLYSSPAQYNQQRQHRLSSASSATSDHPYSRVINDDLNNNCNGSIARTTPIPASRDRPSTQDSNVSYSSIRSKVPSVRGNRSASESDSVFEEEEEYRYPPPYVNVQGQHGGRSRGQVYPENNGALAGFDITHASLV